MKKFLLMCCILVAASTGLFAQTNPVNQAAFLSQVNQLNSYLSQNDLNNAQSVWNNINNMMIADLEYIKQRVTNAVNTQNSTEEAQFTGLAGQQSTFYSEAAILHADMLANQPSLINKLNQFGANIY